MTKEQAALLDVVRSFKKEDISDTEALLNIIANHAKQTRNLTDRVRYLESILDQIAKSACKRQLVEI